jgi:hypothetical protein
MADAGSLDCDQDFARSWFLEVEFGHADRSGGREGSGVADSLKDCATDLHWTPSRGPSLGHSTLTTACRIHVRRGSSVVSDPNGWW